MSQGFQPQGPSSSNPASVPFRESQGRAQYEFGDAENAVIGSVSKRSVTWGTVSIVLGVFQVIAGVAALKTPTVGLVQLVGGVVAIIVGISFRKVGGSFKSVVDTQGNDVGNLLDALRGLDRALVTQLVAVVVGFVIGVVGVAVGASIHT